jgi:hypothetical protein
MTPVCSARECSTAIILYYINKLLKRNNSSKNFICQTNKKFQLIVNCPLPIACAELFYTEISLGIIHPDSWAERRGGGIPWPSKLQGFPIFEESRFRNSLSTSGFTHRVGNTVRSQPQTLHSIHRLTAQSTHCSLYYRLFAPITDSPVNPKIVRSVHRLFALL